MPEQLIKITFDTSGKISGTTVVGSGVGQAGGSAQGQKDGIQELLLRSIDDSLKRLSGGGVSGLSGNLATGGIGGGGVADQLLGEGIRTLAGAPLRFKGVRDSAMERVSGIASQMSAMGQELPKEVMENLYQMFLDQEKRKAQSKSVVEATYAINPALRGQATGYLGLELMNSMGDQYSGNVLQQVNEVSYGVAIRAVQTEKACQRQANQTQGR